ncbi:MAG: ABC transporter substrate-binding protein, partial [Deinococcales bacterium]
MKRRTFIKAGLVVGGAAVLGDFRGTTALAQGAGVTPKKGGTLTWGHSETTQNLDIHKTGTASTLRLLQNVHEPLLTIDDHFKVQPNLAASWERSSDWLTYTFHLRDDVVFHNGKKMTAADVVYSFKRIQDPKTAAVSFDVFNDVASIDAVDDHTVRVTMSSVYSPFEARITYLNCAIIPAGSGDTQGTHPIGAGAFEFVQREFGNYTRLKRYDGYFRGPAYLEEVVEREVTEGTVRLTGVQTGQMTLINDIPLDRIAQVEKDPNLQVETWHPLSWAFMNFNHKSPPFDNPDVRKAFDLMIDKEALVKGALWGQGVPTPTPSFPNSPNRDNA